MAESGESGNRSGGEDMLVPLASNVYLVAGWIAAALAAAALFWLATWTLYDYMPPFEDTVGAVLAETSRGMFIGVGLLGVLIALRVVRGLGGWLAALRFRG